MPVKAVLEGQSVDAWLKRLKSLLWIEGRLKMLNCAIEPHNKALQLTANPLRGLFAAELGR